MTRIENMRYESLIQQQLRESDLQDLLQGPDVRSSSLNNDSVASVTAGEINGLNRNIVTAGTSPTPNWSFSRIAQVLFS